MITFLSTHPALGFGLGVGSFPLPMATGFPPVFFLAVCLVHAIRKQKSMPLCCTVIDLCQREEHSGFIRENLSCDQLVMGPYLELVGGASYICPDDKGLVECIAFTLSLDNLTRVFTAVHST